MRKLFRQKRFNRALLRTYGHCKGEVVASFGVCKGRANDGRKKVGSASGDTGLNDLEDAACVGAAARVWDCAADRAGQPGCAAVERGHGVYVVVAAAAAG